MNYTILASRRLPVAFAVTVALAVLAGCAYPIRAGVDESLNEPLKGANALDLKTRNGRIEVRGDPTAKDVAIAATKSAGGKTIDEARDFADRIEINTSRNASSLSIEPTYPDLDSARNYAVDFRITLPPNVRLNLSTSNGRVIVAAMKGDVEIVTSNGGVDLREIDGRVRADTSNGPIVVKNVHGDLELDTSNGAIDVVASGDKFIRCKTSNGGVRMTAVRGNSRIRTSNGRIELQFVELPPSPNIEVHSSNGGVTVEVPSSASGRLTMSTSNGQLSTDFEAATVSDLQTSRRSLSATLNGGGGSIDLASSNGSVTFRTMKVQLN